MVIWILWSYFKTIPSDIEDAAKVDGCSTIGVIRRIILPLSGPGFVAAGIYCFIECWCEFLYAFMFTSSYNAKTATVAIAEFNDIYVLRPDLICAGGLLVAIIPTIIVLALQRYMVKGLTAGAIKG